jgi:hypothetical protein
MDEAGGADGGGGAAVADTGAGGGESTALATTGDTAITTTGDEGGGEGEGEGELITGEPFRALENGRPSKATSTALQAIHKTHPQLARQIPRDMAVAARLRSEFPGSNPFDAIRAMQRTLKQLGGEEGIAQIRASLADMEEMDLLYSGGDPRMLDKMTQTPEGKAAFTKLAPHAFSLYEKLAPNAFTKYMASVILGDIIGQRVDMTMQRLAELTPRELTGTDGAKMPNPAVAELTKLDGYLKRLQKFEELPSEVTETKTDPAAADLDRQRKELDQEKRGLVLQGWRQAADSEKVSIFNRAWTAETKGKKISPVDKEDIQARFWTRLPIALRQIPGFNDNLKEFFENDDKDGYLRYLQSLHAQKIPTILRAEIQRRYGAPNGTQTQRTETTTTTTNGVLRPPLDAGFKRIGAQPAPNDINMKLTDTSMFKRKQAVLKDGRKVQWG